MAKEQGTSPSVQSFGYGLGNPRLDSGQRRNILLFYESPDRLWGPPALQINEYLGLSERGVNLTMHSSTAEVRKKRGRNT